MATVFVKNIYDELIALEPKPITLFLPSNSEQAKEKFLLNNSPAPELNYNDLLRIDFQALQDEANRKFELLFDSKDLNAEYSEIYVQWHNRFLEQIVFLKLAAEFLVTKNLTTLNEWKQVNRNLYGYPDYYTFNSILSEKLNLLHANVLSFESRRTLNQVLSMLPGIPATEKAMFVPHPETVLWVQKMVFEKFGELLEPLDSFDEKTLFAPSEVAVFLQDALNKLKGAQGWKVSVEVAQSVNVKSSEKKIIVPSFALPVKAKRVKELIVHEVGVHALRAINGTLSGHLLLGHGLPYYYDAEEGIGVVFEQALSGVYQPRGGDHYLTVGFMEFLGFNFRETFEVKWRLKLLEADSKSGKTWDGLHSESRSLAYGQVMRIARGTGHPWFKDLSYHNGSEKIWQFLEEHRGDEEAFKVLFAGKGDPTNSTHLNFMKDVSKLS